MNTKNHIWNFSSVGGVKRVNFESGKDLLALDQLDQKLWTALSCPVYGLEIDHKTLELIDTDNDGQIRAGEIIAATKWITSLVKNPDDLLKQSNQFPLSAINEDSEEGKILLASAKTILSNLGKSFSDYLTVDETSDLAKIFSSTSYNGDGIITEDASNASEINELIISITSLIGNVTDRNGKIGINTDHINSFFEACEAFSNWIKKSEENAEGILPYGNKTEEAFSAFDEIKSKVDDYFLRCRLAAFDSDATNVLNNLTVRIENISARDTSACIEEIATYPLAKIQAGKPLPLHAGINPAWEKQLGNFKNLLLTTWKERDSMTEEEWNIIVNSFSAYIQWKSEKEGAQVESLGIEKVRAILNGNSFEILNSLVAKDIAVETEANNIILVDKMVRYYRDLFTLVKNFVTFYDFYSPDYLAVFQAGTLYIDQRSLDLCIKVSDLNKHNTMVSLSGIYLMYCNCVSKSTNETMTIVAALTNGDIDNLIVGRNAVFYDRSGKDWDATVFKIIENPISIKQAFWSPYRRVSRFIETQVNKFATEKDNKIQADVTSKIEGVPGQIQAQPPAPPPPFDVAKFVGIFAAIGLAIGAIGTALASVISGFMGLVWWKMPFAIIGLLLLISGPAMIIAYIKLRKRNLAPLLDANGWAVNAKANINIAFGNTLTHLAQLPSGAVVNTNDPFVKKKHPLWQTVLLVSIIVGAILYLLIKYEWIKIHF